MKISYRTHPLLEKLAKKSLGKFCISKDEAKKMVQMEPEIKKDFATFCNDPFKTYAIADTFLEAFHAQSHKICDRKMWNEVKSGRYCFLTQDINTAIIINNDLASQEIHVESIEIMRGDNPGQEMLLHFGKTNFIYSDEICEDHRFYTSGFFGFLSLNNTSTYEYSIEQQISCFITLILFMKYAEIETEYSPAEQKVKGVKCKYINETKIDVTHLDCTWFTNHIKSDAFKVRPHLRLQPYKKDGDWTKKWIWISEFEKSGYTRKAKMLNTIGQRDHNLVSNR